MTIDCLVMSPGDIHNSGGILRERHIFQYDERSHDVLIDLVTIFESEGAS